MLIRINDLARNHRRTYAPVAIALLAIALFATHSSLTADHGHAAPMTAAGPVIHHGGDSPSDESNAAGAGHAGHHGSAADEFAGSPPSGDETGMTFMVCLAILAASIVLSLALVATIRLLRGLSRFASPPLSQLFRSPPLAAATGPPARRPALTQVFLR